MEDFIGWSALWLLVLENPSSGPYLDSLFHDKIIMQFVREINVDSLSFASLIQSNHEISEAFK